MNLTITFLGLELLTLHVSTDDTQDHDEPGDCTSQPLGFAGYVGDQRFPSSPGFDM